MAAAASHTVVGQLVSKLTQAAKENVDLIRGIQDQIDDLLKELKEFNAYLTQASRNHSTNNNDVLRNVEATIKSIVNNAEEVIEKFKVVRKKHKDKVFLLRQIDRFRYFDKVNDSARELQVIKERIKKVRADNAAALQALINPPGQTVVLPKMAPVVEEDDVVGFDDEARTIKNRLLEESVDLKVISIEGMAGLGKTTLTKMVFNDRDLQYNFFTSIWVYVSRTFDRRKIFLDILSQFTQNTKSFHDMTDENLAKKISGYLVGGRYFVVVDDVWNENDWDCLKIAFPNNMKGSRVLLTTRHQHVASYADTAKTPHKLKFLLDDESWVLLEKKVFRKEKCPPQLKPTGCRIARKCNGLPLAVVVIAGVLDKNNTATEWQHIAEDPFPAINKEDQDYNKLVKLSYDHLPCYLKECFLYLASFPIGQEIVVWKLICMWIAEGFILLMEGGYTTDLERTGETYLKELVDRNLLMVLERRADGQMKTCRIHDTLHEFCKTEAASSNHFHEMVGGRLDVPKDLCRLSVHSSILEFMKLEKKPFSEHVRSFLSICSKEVEISNEYVSTIPKSFPLLRVLDIEKLKFRILPKEFYHLYHLRYLAISTDLKLLPNQFEKLWNMQTLVLYSSQNNIEVKADIWKITKLRHVHCKTSMRLPIPPKFGRESSRTTTEIQTLSTVSPSSCTEEIFNMTPDLHKLGIRGNITELVETRGGVCLFNNLQKLDRLENLKMINDSLQKNKLLRIPRAENFPRRLRKLTLVSTPFEWKDFQALASLEELEVLKLVDNAFEGDFCDVSGVIFEKLQYFRIERSNLAYWTVSKNSFPVLKNLIIRNCTKIGSVPPEFGQVESLKVMELNCTSKTTAGSAQKIHELSGRRFVLSIYPPADYVASSSWS